MAVLQCRALIFDLDGVLISSEAFWFKVMNETAVAAGAPAISRSAFAASWGQDVAADAATFFPGWSAEQVRRHYAEQAVMLSDHLEVSPGTADVIIEATRRGVFTGLVTNSPRWLVDIFLLLCDVRFDVIITAEEVAAPKPAPDGLLQSCQALGVKAHEATFVGDTPFDRQAAVRASMPFVGMGTPARTTISSLAELLPLLPRTAAMEMTSAQRRYA